MERGTSLTDPDSLELLNPDKRDDPIKNLLHETVCSSGEILQQVGSLCPLHGDIFNNLECFWEPCIE